MLRCSPSGGSPISRRTAAGHPEEGLKLLVPPEPAMRHFNAAAWSHSLGEFPTYAEARDAIVDFWTMKLGRLPRGFKYQIQYHSDKTSDYWSEVGDTNLRVWFEFLDLNASMPHGPLTPQGYMADKDERAQTRKWFARKEPRFVHYNRNPPDAALSVRLT